MTILRESLTDYLAMRRGLGFKLQKAGRGLTAFVSFTEQQNAEYITTSIAMTWAHQATAGNQAARRLSFVRVFAQYMTAIDVRTEVPSSELLPIKAKRACPYLYTETQVQQLLAAALELPSANGLRSMTYYCLFGLLVVTGMRLGEAISLLAEDVDLKEGLLTIRGAKFGKSRLVPIHPTTRQALSDYKETREKVIKTPCAYFFINSRSKRLDESQVESVFRLLSRQIGLRAQDSRIGPRIHDFRHRMAVETLLRWYRNGDDPERRLPVLATYLGHVHVRNTYWYLTACPELMQEAVKSLERRWELKTR